MLWLGIKGRAAATDTCIVDDDIDRASPQFGLISQTHDT